MKILHVNSRIAPVGGAEIFLRRMVQALKENGDQSVVVHGAPEDPAEGLVSHAVPFLTETQSFGRAPIRRQYEEILNRERPDLIHLHRNENADVLELSAKHAPTVQTVHDHQFYCPGGAKYLPLKKQLCHHAFGPVCLKEAFLTHCNSIRPQVLWGSYLRTKRLLQGAHHVTFLVLSQYQKDQLMRHGVAEKSIRFLPPFVDNVEKATAPSPNPDSESRILFAGRLTWHKGLKEFIECLSQLTVSYEAVICGDGPELKKGKNLASRLGVQDKVRFLGWVSSEDCREQYRKADVVVVPSTWPEPFGMAGIEAMSAGKPVVAFDVGGIPDWLEDKINGFLVPAGDVSGLAVKLERLIHHPGEAVRMGEEGRRIVRERYSKEAFLKTIRSVYTDP